MQISRVRSSLACLALVAWATVLPGVAAAEEAVYDPAAVKAAFLYHFSTFVKWPGDQPQGDTFVIAVLGDDDVVRELEQYLPGRRILNRPMQVVRIDSVADLDRADVLFVGARRADDLEQSVETIREQPVLVVAETPDALNLGAMINFRIVDRRVRFEVFLPAAERAGLSLSSRLLAAAFQVRTSGLLKERSAIVVAYRGNRWRAGADRGQGTCTFVP